MMKSKVILVTGGARSGKSRFAEEYAAYLTKESFFPKGTADLSTANNQGGRIVYMATSQVYDQEMERRVAEHRISRPAEWTTVEEPYHLKEALLRLADEPVSVVLIDCVTLWISNLLLLPNDLGKEKWMNPKRSEEIIEAVREVSELLKQASFSTILVTNEVGSSIVPEYPLGRVYRDLAGRVNQLFASKADEVFLVTSGISVNLRELAWAPQREIKRNTIDR